MGRAALPIGRNLRRHRHPHVSHSTTGYDCVAVETQSRKTVVVARRRGPGFWHRYPAISRSTIYPVETYHLQLGTGHYFTRQPFIHSTQPYPAHVGSAPSIT